MSFTLCILIIKYSHFNMLLFSHLDSPILLPAYSICEKNCVQMLLFYGFPLTFTDIFYLRAGGEDSAFSNSSIILQLREQVSQLQGILQEKEESEKTAAQKLAMYQNQLHAKNNEVSTLKDQLQAQVCFDFLGNLYTACTFSQGISLLFSLMGEYVIKNL